MLGMVVIFFAIALHNKSNQNCHNPASNEAVHQSSVRCFVGSNVERIATNTNQGQTKEDKKYELEISNHEAQIDMAWSAKIGVLLGLLGSYLLYWTLCYTRDAADASKKTLGIADKTLKETVSANRRSQRAYLAVERAFVINVIVGQPIKLKVTIENYGPTPAKMLGSAETCGIFINGVKTPLNPPKETFTDLMPPTGKRHFTIVSSNELTSEQLTDIRMGKKIAMGAVSIIYEDIFNIKRTFSYMGTVDKVLINKNDSLRYAFAQEIENKKTAQ